MLIGKLIRLRPVEEEDLALLVRWRNEPRIWVGFFNKFPLSMGGQKAWYADLGRDPARKLFMICTLVNDAPVGTIGLDHVDFPNQSAEFGNLLIGEIDALGKGFAEEATCLLLAYCFQRLNINRVYLKAYADNGEAIRLYERCGFRREGILREAQFEGGRFLDVLVMSLLRREFVPPLQESEPW